MKLFTETEQSSSKQDITHSLCRTKEMTHCNAVILDIKRNSFYTPVTTNGVKIFCTGLHIFYFLTIKRISFFSLVEALFL
jgi:hypothetical protein